MELLRDIESETVDFVPNYDGYEQQPLVLPARFPNLLVNGAGGIAVGMATNIPPHNLGEVIDAVVHYLDNPEATPAELMKFVKAPDFPTGATIMGRQGIRDAYETGRGSIKVRAVTQIEEGTNGRSQDRRHRAALPGEQGAAGREDRRPREDAEDQGHRRPPGRVQPRGHAPGDRDASAARTPRSC